MVVIKLPYRSTIKTNAITQCHVLFPDGTELKPVYEARSGTGAHGEDVYEIDQTVYVVEYNEGPRRTRTHLQSQRLPQNRLGLPRCLLPRLEILVKSPIPPLFLSHHGFSFYIGSS